jgi:hypothetical protein
MLRNSQLTVDMDKAFKKWKPIVEKLGVTSPEKIHSMCEYAEMHASAITAGMVKENVAYANSANTAGMGNVVMPGLSGTPGIPGTAGSGDLGQTLLPGALKIAAQTIGLELVPTINVNSNRVDLLFFDFTYDDTNGLDNDERATTFKIASNNAANLATWLRTIMAENGVTELRGRISKPLYFKAGAAAGASYNPTVKPSAPYTNWFEFKGFSRIDGLPMFRVFVQANTASSGAWAYDVNLNTLPASGSLVAHLSTLSILDPTDGEIGVAIGTVAPGGASLVSLNEDFIDGFTTAHGKNAMTRGQWDVDQAGKIGPNSEVKSVEIGVAHVSAALRLSEVSDYKRMYGIDIVQKTQAQLINQISQQISAEIVEKVKEMGLKNRASAPRKSGSTAYNTAIPDATMFDFDVEALTGALQGEHNASVARKLWAKVTNASYFIANDGRIGGADYMICSGTVASALKSIQGYTINPYEGKIAGPNQLQPAGQIDGIKIMVDPYMGPADLSIFLGRKGKADDPGIKFLAYMLAESVEITSEKTMGPRLYLYSRYAVTEFGWFPEKQYMALKVYDPAGILS